MIGELLKGLLPAIGRFARYHVSRPFRRGQKPVSPGTYAATLATTAGPAPAPKFPHLDNDAGLGADYAQLVSWPAYRLNVPGPEILTDPLYQLWKTTTDGHKWSHYFGIYQQVFGPRHTEPLRILEIGVWRGSSLRLWRQYFTHPQTLIVGIDIRPECLAYDAPLDGIRVRIGSQADATFLKAVVAEFGPFDIIIDDGSHHSSHLIASFNHLYSDGLKDSGIYFAEDLHANYWYPWRDSQRSFLDLCKELLEHMHAHYRAAPAAAFLVNEPSDQSPVPIIVPRITTMIQEIRFFDSMVAIYKRRLEHMPYYMRLGL